VGARRRRPGRSAVAASGALSSVGGGRGACVFFLRESGGCMGSRCQGVGGRPIWAANDSSFVLVGVEIGNEQAVPESLMHHRLLANLGFWLS
jgi:hypothetical protein